MHVVFFFSPCIGIWVVYDLLKAFDSFHACSKRSLSLLAVIPGSWIRGREVVEGYCSHSLLLVWAPGRQDVPQPLPSSSLDRLPLLERQFPVQSLNNGRFCTVIIERGKKEILALWLLKEKVCVCVWVFVWGAIGVLEGEIMLFSFALLGKHGNMGGGRGEKVN